MTSAILLSLLSGVMFAVAGVAYRVGMIGNVQANQCGVGLSVIGFIGFGLLGYQEWQYLDWRLALILTVTGVAQYLVMLLLRYALKTGPLSPAWCAVSLGFIPVIIYAAIGCGEKLSVCQYISIAATVGAIVSASFSGEGSKDGEKQSSSWVNKVIYCIILLLLVVFNSTLPVALKLCSNLTFLNSSVTYKAGCGNVILSIVYFFIMALGAIDLTVRKQWVFNRYACYGPVLLALGACSAYGLQLYLVDRAPAVIVFALSNTVSILGAALISVGVFKEKITRAWYFTIGFSILAIILNR